MYWQCQQDSAEIYVVIIKASNIEPLIEAGQSNNHKGENEKLDNIHIMYWKIIILDSCPKSHYSHILHKI